MEVHFACNDGRGNFAYELWAVEAFDEADEGDLSVKIEGDPVQGLPFSRNPGVTVHVPASISALEPRKIGASVLVGGSGSTESFMVEGWSRWSGNMAWDRCEMSEEEFLRLAKWLLSNGMSMTEVSGSWESRLPLDG